MLDQAVAQVNHWLNDCNRASILGRVIRVTDEVIDYRNWVKANFEEKFIAANQAKLTKAIYRRGSISSQESSEDSDMETEPSAVAVVSPGMAMLQPSVDTIMVPAVLPPHYRPPPPIVKPSKINERLNIARNSSNNNNNKSNTDQTMSASQQESTTNSMENLDDNSANEATGSQEFVYDKSPANNKKKKQL